MKARGQWGLVGLALAVFGGLLMGQRLQRQRLHEELAELRAQRLAVKQSTPETWRVEKAAIDPAPTRNRDDELSQLRREVAGLKRKFREMELAERKQPEPAAIRNLAVGDWANAGRATPQAALETALWAAAAGELDALEQTLILDERARDAAGQLFERLSPEARTEYPNPERLIALLAAKDVPASTMMAHVSELPSRAAGEARLRVKLQDASGATRTGRLTLRATGAGWRVVVSDRDVTRLAANLKQ
jgi:hypothetical protein